MQSLATDGAGAVTSAMNSAGSAMEENSRYMDSVQGKVEQLKTAFQSFSSSVISSDLMKGVLSVITSFLKGLSSIIDSSSLALPTILGLGTGIGLFVKNFG